MKKHPIKYINEVIVDCYRYIYLGKQDIKLAWKIR